MPKVGVVGYYGYDNFGDEWMLATMRALAPDVTFIPFTSKGSEQWLSQVSDVDAIIIGGDLLIPIPLSLYRLGLERNRRGRFEVYH